MKRYVPFIYWLVFMVVFCGIGIWLGVYFAPKSANPEFSIPVESTKYTMNYSGFRDQLTEWVYSHSTRISRATAEKIVNEAFRYPNPVLLLALIKAESDFTPTARGSSGEIGLGQIVFKLHSQTLLKYNIAKTSRDLYDIETNIRATALLFNDALKRAQGDPVQAIKLYNGKHRPTYQNDILVAFTSMMLLWRE